MRLSDFIIRNPLKLKNNSKITIWMKGEMIYQGLFYKIDIDENTNIVEYDKFYGEACLIASK